MVRYFVRYNALSEWLPCTLVGYLAAIETMRIWTYMVEGMAVAEVHQ
jgi:hypothetical protein